MRRQLVRLPCLLGSGSPWKRTIWNDCASSSDVTATARFYDSSVERYASQDIEVLSLSQMLQFGRRAVYDRALILKSARMIQRELPKRLARRLMDLQFLPHIVVINPHIKQIIRYMALPAWRNANAMQVYDAYYHAFSVLRDMHPVTSFEDNAQLDILLRRLLDEHAPMLDALAAGVRECRSKAFVGDKLQLDAFLDGMLRSRISRRVLAEQHLHLGQAHQDFIGVICTNLHLADALDLAIQRARQACTEWYGSAPSVTVTGSANASLAYIPNHLDYMLFELLKNAMRAVVEKHAGRRSVGAMPPIAVRIADAESCVTVRISDQGGGVVDNDLVWNYGFTTMPAYGAQPQVDGVDTWPSMGRSEAPEAVSPMAGLGFGLPLSRLHARYFGGDLKLVSMPGYGTDAYLTVQHLEGQWEEPYAEHLESVTNAAASWSSGVPAAHVE